MSGSFSKVVNYLIPLRLNGVDTILLEHPPGDPVMPLRSRFDKALTMMLAAVQLKVICPMH